MPKKCKHRNCREEIENIRRALGWNDTTLRDLAEEFIAVHNLSEDFREFLGKRAMRELEESEKTEE